MLRIVWQILSFTEYGLIEKWKGTTKGVPEFLFRPMGNQEPILDNTFYIFDQRVLSLTWLNWRTMQIDLWPWIHFFRDAFRLKVEASSWHILVLLFWAYIGSAVGEWWKTLSKRKIFVPQKKRRMRRKRKTNLWRMEKAYIGSAVDEGWTNSIDCSSPR